VHLALAGLFPPGEICPERHQPEFDRLPDEELSRFRVFSGHFYWDQLTRVAAPRIVFTFLREPRKRLLSVYYFFRAHRWSVIEADVLRAFSRRRAKEMPIRPYLMSAEVSIRRETDNVITRRLLGREYLDSSGTILVSDDDAVELAIQHLRSADAFGLAERSRESVASVRQRTGLNLPPLQLVNDLASLQNTEQFEAVERQLIDGDTEAEIQRCVRLDNQVYEWACREFRRRVRDLAPAARAMDAANKRDQAVAEPSSESAESHQFP
jgi:hypothetical protein